MDERIGREHKVFNNHFETVSEDADYFEFLANTVDQFPPMSDDCRITVNIPACEEEGRIYDSLHNMFINAREEPKQLTRHGCTLGLDTYEVNIFDNWDAQDSQDGTSEEIKRFMSDYPHIPLHLISVGLPSPNANVGFARRVLQDAVVMRSMRRAGQAGPLYIASEDADNEGFDAYALSTYADYLDEHPEAVGARMHMIMNTVTLSQIPHRFMSHRMNRLANILMERANQTGPCSEREGENGFCSKNLPPAGVGVAYTAADMLDVGGYQNAVSSEDLSLWLRLYNREINTDNRDTLLHTLPTYTITSPRRLLASFIADQNMYGTHDDFTRLHDEVRRPLNELIAAAQAKYALEENRARTQVEISETARWELHRHVSSEERWRSVGKVMLGLGFTTSDYTFQDTEPEVTVHRWEDVESRVLQYRPSSRLRQCMNI